MVIKSTDSDLVLHAPVLVREPAWPAFANHVQPLFIRVVQSFWTHSNSLLKVIQSEFNRNQSQLERTAPTTNTADPERYSLLKWLSHEKLVATNRAIIHRLRSSAFQTSLQHCAVVPATACGHLQDCTVWEVFPQNLKCGLHLPQCAVGHIYAHKSIQYMLWRIFIGVNIMKAIFIINIYRRKVI